MNRSPESFEDRHAREVIEEIAATIEKDEVRGVIYMQDGEGGGLNSVREFASWQDIEQSLTSVGERCWEEVYEYDESERMPDVRPYVEDVFVKYDIKWFFERIARPSVGTKIVDAHDLTRQRAGLVIQVDLTDINRELVDYLALNPAMMREMEPRKFEALVAELFKHKGYDVELTPRTHDGGFDIRAFRRSDIGTCLTLIECKRYASNRSISVGVVRELYGVVESRRATMGIVATTSFFSGAARSFQAQNKYRLEIADFDRIKAWLSDYQRHVDSV